VKLLLFVIYIVNGVHLMR